MSQGSPAASRAVEPSPDSFTSPALVKTEPEEDARSFDHEVIVERVQSEPEQLLYADHEIKEEMVIGPTEVRRPAPKLCHQYSIAVLSAIKTSSLEYENARLYHCRVQLRDAREELLCAECGQWSLTAAELQRHKRMHEVEGNEPVLIQPDGRQTERFKGSNRELKLTKGQSHRCDQCDGQFHCKSALIRHQYTHRPPKKKKPRFEPPTKKTGEDTTRKTAALIDVPASVCLPTTVQENDAGCGKVDDKIKCKTKVKSVNAKSKQVAVKKFSDIGSGKIDDINKCKAKVKSVKAKSKQVVLKDKVKLDCDQNKTQTKKKTEQTCEKPDVKMLNIDAKPKTVTQSIVNELNATQTFKSVAIDGDNNVSTVICNKCNDKFNTKPKLLEHILSTHNSIKDPLFRCQHCSYETATNSYLERHLKLHDIKRKHGCNVCLFRFKTNAHLKEHMISKHETRDKKHSCDICEYKTHNLSLLDLHLNKHAGVKSYACTLCSYKSNRNSDLKKHMRTHTGESLYACNQCSYKCNQIGHLKLHMGTHTGEKPFACNVCTYKCNQSSHLKAHMRTHTGEKPFACNVCSYKCNQSSHLKRHMRTHTGEKPFACNVCSYKCNRSSNLKDHMRTHTGEKPFACNVCSYKCNQSSYLKGHMRTHTGERPFACNVCSYKCSVRSSLKGHMRTHTGEKPFACNLCTYKCNQSSHLKDHIRTHTGEKPYACNICSYKCSVSSSLKKHMRTHENK